MWTIEVALVKKHSKVTACSSGSPFSNAMWSGPRLAQRKWTWPSYTDRTRSVMMNQALNPDGVSCAGYTGLGLTAMKDEYVWPSRGDIQSWEGYYEWQPSSDAIIAP